MRKEGDSHFLASATHCRSQPCEMWRKTWDLGSTRDRTGWDRTGWDRTGWNGTAWHRTAQDTASLPAQLLIIPHTLLQWDRSAHSLFCAFLHCPSFYHQWVRAAFDISAWALQGCPRDNTKYRLHLVFSSFRGAVAHIITSLQWRFVCLFKYLFGPHLGVLLLKKYIYLSIHIYEHTFMYIHAHASSGTAAELICLDMCWKLAVTKYFFTSLWIKILKACQAYFSSLTKNYVLFQPITLNYPHFWNCPSWAGLPGLHSPRVSWAQGLMVRDVGLRFMNESPAKHVVSCSSQLWSLQFPSNSPFLCNLQCGSL